MPIAGMTLAGLLQKNDGLWSPVTAWICLLLLLMGAVTALGAAVFALLDQRWITALFSLGVIPLALIVFAITFLG